MFEEFVNGLTLMNPSFLRLVLREEKVGFEFLKLFDLMKSEREVLDYFKINRCDDQDGVDMKWFTLIETIHYFVGIQEAEEREELLPESMNFIYLILKEIIHIEKNKVNIVVCNFDPGRKGKPYDTMKALMFTQDAQMIGTNKTFLLNGLYQGDDKFGDFVHDLHCKDANEMKNEVLKEQVRYYKETKRGRKALKKIYDAIA